MRWLSIVLVSCVSACAPGPESVEPRAAASTTVAATASADDAAVQLLAKRSEQWLGNNDCALSCHTTFAFALMVDIDEGSPVARSTTMIGSTRPWRPIWRPRLRC